MLVEICYPYYEWMKKEIELDVDERWFDRLTLREKEAYICNAIVENNLPSPTPTLHGCLEAGTAFLRRVVKRPPTG